MSEPVLCDFVWFTSEHYPACLDLIKRLTPEECAARDKFFGLEEWENVPIPDSTGKIVGSGFCICRDAFGFSHFFKPGRQKNGKALIAEQMMLETIKPGLVVGNVLHNVLESEEFKKDEAAHKTLNAQMAEKRVIEDGKKKEQLLIQAQGAHHRFLITAAHFSGIREPSKIRGDELSDIYYAAEMMNKELPNYDKWMDRFGPKIPNQEIPTDFHAYVAQGKAAVIAPRKEIVRPLQ
jgi:hypothetical protein